MNINLTIEPLVCQSCKQGYILPMFEYIASGGGLGDEEGSKLEACLSGWACSNPECSCNIFYDYSAEKPCLRTLPKEK